MIDWDGLRVLLAIARAGSLVGAARRLDVDRATVLRRLAAIEEALGARLFDRTRDGCSITDAGRAALATAEGVDASVGLLASRLAGADARLTGPVRVTCPEWLACAALQLDAGSILLENPGLSLDLVTTNDMLRMSQLEADIAIRNVRPRQKTLKVRTLADIGFGLYASPAYLAARGPLGAGAGHLLATWDAAMAYMPGVAWIEAKLPEARVAVRATETLPLLHAARASVGLALLPCCLGDADRALVRVTPPIATTRAWMVVHPEVQRTARVRAVVDHLAALFRRHAALIRGR